MTSSPRQISKDTITIKKDTTMETAMLHGNYADYGIAILITIAICTVAGGGLVWGIMRLFGATVKWWHILLGSLGAFAVILKYWGLW
jgi:hypothetical protein